MRKLTILLILLVAVSFADVLFDQSYQGSYDVGWRYSGSNIRANRFTLANPARIESLE